MTRATSFGIKRTYIQADLTHEQKEPEYTSTTLLVASTNDEGTSGPPKKKKRIRTPKSKRDGYAAQRAAEAAARGEAVEGETVGVVDGQTLVVLNPPSTSTSTTNTIPKPGASKSAKKKQKNKDRMEKIKSATEARRVKRIKEKSVTTTCFACREKGHSAKDCPMEVGVGNGAAVGLCYRCGSTKHSLSRCKKPNNPADPYPFASCFVCNGKGHLASACLQNKAKGVYPNGGCCKLCGETSHLARDCNIRQKTTVDPAAILGTGSIAGADEDDFHTFKRTTTELDRNEKEIELRKKKLDVKMGVLSGKAVQFGHVLAPAKKVVIFT